MGIIYINGVEFPAPDVGLNMVVADNVSSGKNSLGEFVGQKVGRTQYKLDSLQWKFLDAETWAQILQQFENFVALVRFPDMVHNEWLTLEMYPGNRTATPVEINPETGLPSRYKDCKVNIIDCGRT